MKGLPISAKVFILFASLIFLMLTLFKINMLYSRHKNSELKKCLARIEIGDSSAEVIEKMKPYRKKPDRTLNNQTVYLWQAELEGYTLLIYDPLFVDSGGHIFYFPPEKDSLVLYGPE
jgi:hypothetical protein